MRFALSALFFLIPASFAVGSCALGHEEEPGCKVNADCEEGFVCRAGACFRITTPLSPPPDEDAGDAADGDGMTPTDAG